MTEQVSGLSEQLRALGRELTVPVPDDLADRVQAAIAAPRPGAPKWRRLVAAIAALLLAIGVAAAVSAPVRAAISHVFGFGGVEVRQGPGPTPVPSPTLPGQHQTSLAAAGQEVGFRVRVPGALGIPDSVTVADGRVVSLHYARPSGPVQIDEFAGDLGIMWEKYALSGIAQPVTVGAHQALWFDGPVTLVYDDANGTEQLGSARQTDGTLVWIDGDLTMRLDGIRPLDAALAVARSVS